MSSTGTVESVPSALGVTPVNPPKNGTGRAAEGVGARRGGTAGVGGLEADGDGRARRDLICDSANCYLSTGRTTMGTRWTRWVIARPLPTVPAVAGILPALTLPATDMRLALPDNGSAPHTSTERKAHDTIEAKFGPGFNGPLGGPVTRIHLACGGQGRRARLCACSACAGGGNHQARGAGTAPWRRWRPLYSVMASHRSRRSLSGQ